MYTLNSLAPFFVYWTVLQSILYISRYYLVAVFRTTSDLIFLLSCPPPSYVLLQLALITYSVSLAFFCLAVLVIGGPFLSFCQLSVVVATILCSVQYFTNFITFIVGCSIGSITDIQMYLKITFAIARPTSSHQTYRAQLCLSRYAVVPSILRPIHSVLIDFSLCF